MAKYLIDASIIASSLEDFKRRYVLSTESILVLSNLTLDELENRKKDSHCSNESKKFVRYLIDLFARDKSTEVCRIEAASGHIDGKLVEFAQANNLSILTCDKGMAVRCRFYDVPFELLEARSVVTLPFITTTDNSLYVNLFNGSIPKDFSVFVYSTSTNKIIRPLENGIIFLNPGNILLVAHPENGICGIDTYYVNSEMNLNCISKNIYSSEENIDVNTNPFHKQLFKKWNSYMNKNNKQ